MSFPASMSRSLIVSASPWSCLRPTLDMNGTCWRASSVTDIAPDATASGGRDARNQVGALAHHPRAWHDQVEPGRERSIAHVGPGVREDAQQRRRLAHDLRGV